MSDNFMIPTRSLPMNFGPLKGANGNARITGPCGDTMEFWVIVEDAQVTLATYTTDGCSHSIACGFAAAALANGQPLSMVRSLTPADVLAVAGDIPDESNHCALLAVNTLNAAVNAYAGS